MSVKPDLGLQSEVFDLLERGATFTKDGDRVLSSQPGIEFPERSFRRVIGELRLAGYPVIATSEARSTYRKAHDVGELDAFIGRELLSRASVLHSQAHNLREHQYDYLPRPRDPLAVTNETLWEDQP